MGQLLSSVLLWLTQSAGWFLPGVFCTDTLCGTCGCCQWQASCVNKTKKDHFSLCPKCNMVYLSALRPTVPISSHQLQQMNVYLLGFTLMIFQMRSGSLVFVVRTSLHTYTLRDIIQWKQPKRSQFPFKILWVGKLIRSPFCFHVAGAGLCSTCQQGPSSLPVIQHFQNITTFPRIFQLLPATQSQHQHHMFAIWCGYRHIIKYTYMLMQTKCNYNPTLTWVWCFLLFTLLQSFINRIFKNSKPK